MISTAHTEVAICTHLANGGIHLYIMLTLLHANEKPAVSRLAIPGSPQVSISLFHIHIYSYVFIINYEFDMYDALHSCMYYRRTQNILLWREEKVTGGVEHVISFC